MLYVNATFDGINTVVGRYAEEHDAIHYADAIGRLFSDSPGHPNHVIMRVETAGMTPLHERHWYNGQYTDVMRRR